MEIFNLALDKSSYNPGDTIKGNVVFFTSLDIPSNLLKVRGIGKANTEWMEMIGTVKKRAFSYSADFTYLSTEIVVWLPEDETTSLPAGQHTFPFSIRLPDHCPPSFEGFWGDIRYFVIAELAPDYKTEKRVNVLPIVHLSSIPGALSPMVSFVSKNTGLMSGNGMVFMTATLPKRVFTPKEVIPILISIENVSKKTAIAVVAQLKRHTLYIAANHKESDFGEIASAHRQISISPKSKGQLELTLKVPNTVCTFQSELINMNYSVKVKVKTMSLFGSSLSCNFDVLIGNVPRATPTVERRAPGVKPPGYPGVRGLPPTYHEAVVSSLMNRESS